MAQVIQLLALALMAVLLPLAPLACAVIASNAQQRWGFLRRYGHTVKQSARTVWALHQAQVIARNIELALAPPAAAQVIEGSCTHCGRCCLNSACVFLSWTGDGLSRCSIHNNWFWKLTSCGSYPVNAQSIAVYDCPSFKAVPIRVVQAPKQPQRQPGDPKLL